MQVVEWLRAMMGATRFRHLPDRLLECEEQYPGLLDQIFLHGAVSDTIEQQMKDTGEIDDD